MATTQISPPEAARLLAVHPKTVRRWVRSGVLSGRVGPGPYERSWVDLVSVEILLVDREERALMSAWLIGQTERIWSEPMGAALFVLDHPALRGTARLHVDVENRRIAWRAIRAGCPADADQVLIDAAEALFTQTGGITLIRLLAALSDDRLDRVLLAIKLSREMISRQDALRALERGRRR